MSTDIANALSLREWLPSALLFWLTVVASLAGAGVVLGALLVALRAGPKVAADATGKVLADAARDIFGLSLQRVGALTWLTIKESVRRRVVVVFAVFILLLLFAGWFLDPGSTEPAKLYLSFVLTSTNYLVLLLALLLSALSLPNDIKNRTLHTVVTKPVRQSEIVLGRMLGFTLVGTVLLLVMGGISYAFVVRGLAHQHDLVAADVELTEKALSDLTASDAAAPQFKLNTTRVHGHRHTVLLDPAVLRSGEKGTTTTEMEQGHWHEVSYQVVREKSGEGVKAKLKYTIGPEQGMLVARVPIYGQLRFKDRAGKDSEKGVSVGEEWTYRSYIEGGTLAAAVWTFHGLSEEQFPDGLPVEMNIAIFRTSKGIIEAGVLGTLSVRNPKTGEQVEVRMFPAKEYVADVQFIPRQLQDAKHRQRDLFRDLASDGELEIWLRCFDPQQYFGAAQPDLYLRARDAPFWLNFVKSYLGIWLQMTLVVGFGVMFSTFLSGPIAVLATAGALLGGMFNPFMSDLAGHKVIGGGPIESLIRMVNQQNLIIDLEPGFQTTAAKMSDKLFEHGLRVVSAILPDFGTFTFTNAQDQLYLAAGFDIPWDLTLQCVCRALAFMLPLFVAGYVFLKTREVGQ